MKITNKSLTRLVLPLLDEDKMRQVMDAVDEVPLKKPITECTVGEYIEMLAPDYCERFFREKYAVIAFGKMKRFEREMTKIGEMLKKWEVKSSDDELAAMRGILFPTPSERLLLDVVDVFHLTAMERPKGLRGLFIRAAVDVPLCEYLIHLKSANASAKYQRQYNSIMEHKYKG